MQTITSRPTLLSALVFVAMLMLAGCAGVPGQPPPGAQACTEIGCSSGLIVELEGAVPASFQIEAATAGADAQVAECPDGAPAIECDPSSVFFRDFLPDDVQITITWDGQSVTQEFAPAYEELRPNGPGCPPVCSQARVTIEFPQ